MDSYDAYASPGRRDGDSFSGRAQGELCRHRSPVALFRERHLT